MIKSLHIFFALLITLVASAQQIERVNGREYIVHKVAPKETLYGISMKYGIPQDTIIACNPALASGLKADQVLRFPKQLLTPSSKKNENSGTHIMHTVLPGETLYGLSKKYLIKT